MKIYPVLLVIFLTQSKTTITVTQWQAATLLDYNSAKFYAAYTQDEPTTTRITILDGSQNELVPQFQVTTDDTNTDGYLFCYAEHKVCEVFVTKILELKALYASIEISLLTTDMTEDQAITTAYVGRNLQWPATVESNISLQNFNEMEQTFGGIEPSQIGWSAVPTKVDAFIQSGNLVGIRVTFSTSDGSPESTQTFGTVASGQQNELQLTSVEEIRLFHVTDGLGAVCGINIVDGGINNNFGCTTNLVSFPMGTNFAFAGFSALQRPSGDGVLILYPLQYQLLHPRVVQWEATDEEITFTFNIFWPASSLKYFETLRKTARNADNQVASETEPELVSAITEATPYTGFYSVAVSSPLPCSPVGLVINTEQTENRMFEDQTVFYAWTYGYQDDQTTTVDIDNPTSDGPTFSSRPKYTSMIASDATCVNILPVKFNIAASQLVVNDNALGDSSQSNSGSDVNLAGKFINKVTVHVDSSNFLSGLTLMFDNFALGTVGSDPSSGSDIVSNPSGDNLVLWYIESTYENDKTTRLTFHWAQPREPVLIKGVNVQNSATGPVISPDFTGGVDAHMQKIIWYNSVDYTNVKLHLFSTSTGAEITDQISFLESEQTRGVDGSGIVRSLVASSTYSLYLEGIVEFVPEVNADAVSIMSIESENQTFITPPGADVICGETTGAMKIQIEYEAVPSLSTNFDSQTETILTPTNENGLETKSSVTELQPSIWPSDTLFSNDAGDAGVDFTGYPIGVKSYWGQIDNCIRGLALVYRVYGNNQISVWIAGNEDGYTNSPAELKTEENFNQAFSSVLYQLAGTGPNCLSGIQFASTCIGPSATCSSTSTTGDNNQLFYGATSQSSADGIFGLRLHFASTEFPSLSAIQKSCELTEIIDQFWLRSTYWSLDLDLSTDVGECGTFQELLDSQTATGSFIDQNVVYQQNVAMTQEEILNGSSDLLALKNWHVAAYCFYNSEGDVTGKVANVQQNVYTLSSAGEIPFKMEIFPNYKYSIPYKEQSPRISMGDPIYVKISAQTDLSNFEVISTDCWATMRADANDLQYYTLQTDTCAVDPTFERDIVDTPLSYAFHFTAFSWLNTAGRPSDSPIYLHCDVRACPQGEAYCEVKDPSECGGTSRKRRSLEQDVAPFGSKHYRLHRKDPIIVVNDQSPRILQVMREEVTVIQIEQNSSGSVEELLKLVTFFLAVLVLWFYLKKIYFGKGQNPLRKF